MVNDVSAGLADEEMLPLVAERGVSICLMHMQGTPGDMQNSPMYEDVVREVLDHLRERARACLKAGIDGHKIQIDPGIGFGKRLSDNLELLAHPAELRARLGLPVLVGPSRKGFLGSLTGDPLECRDRATAAACAVAVFAGADAVRVHDVAGAVRAVAVASALRAARKEGLA